MNGAKKKCSLIDHKDLDAISFCDNCKILMCNKCEIHHSELFKNHEQYKLEKNIDESEIFTGLCQEVNHTNKLIYFCKNHNNLCCAECVTKIKGENNGNHADCDICFIKDIEKEKIEKLNEYIKNLEELSVNFEQSINQLKKNMKKLMKIKNL